jgi:hypothetical protein
MVTIIDILKLLFKTTLFLILLGCVIALIGYAMGYGKEDVWTATNISDTDQKENVSKLDSFL